ncbi:MAG: thiosulfate oxidation carrier protein SoxY [Armatimonadota bacterium]|nr:thiosulfate oxidation carrier protein SoxY [Armatimonadota bacterium]
MSQEEYFTRREFLKAASVLGLGSTVLSALGLADLAFASTHPLQYFKAVRDTKSLTALEKEHLINIRLPAIAEDGANVPIVVSMGHPMERDHYIKSIQILNFRDPVVNKGIYYFTPANGEAYISTQIRMDGGDAEIFVIAECSKHGKWIASKKLKVSLGGC